jgi:hypothetical protein
MTGRPMKGLDRARRQHARRGRRPASLGGTRRRPCPQPAEIASAGAIASGAARPRSRDMPATALPSGKWQRPGRLCQQSEAAMITERARRLRPGRAAHLRPARGQQPARHPVRHGAGQATLAVVMAISAHGCSTLPAR